MKALFKLYTSTALLCVGVLLSSQESIAATATVCGSVSMTPDALSTGTIDCIAYGTNNISLDGSGGFTLAPSTQTVVGDLPDYDTVIDSGVSFNTSTGGFTIESSIWNTWQSIYVAIKQASDPSGGGWGLFEISAIVTSGDYMTKLGCTGDHCNFTDISHEFAIGGTPQGTVPPIPVPAAVWLFGSGLVGLIGLGQRRRTTI